MIRTNLLPLMLNEFGSGEFVEKSGVTLNHGEFAQVICLARCVVCQVDGIN